MNIELTLTGTWDEILEEMRRHIPAPTLAEILDSLSLEEVFIYVSKRAEEAGYDFEVFKPGEKKLSPAEQKREEARARLRGDLEASLKAETPPKDDQVLDEPETEEPKPARKAREKTSKPSGNGHAETPAEMKMRCMDKLHRMFNEQNKKAEVMKILADFGGGSKNFSSIPEEAYGPISAALEAFDG